MSVSLRDLLYQTFPHGGRKTQGHFNVFFLLLVAETKTTIEHGELEIQKVYFTLVKHRTLCFGKT